MKKLTSISLFFLLCYSLFTPAYSAANSPVTSEIPSCELTMAWSEWPPYITYKDGAFSGLYMDLYRWIENEMGCEFRFINLSWSESLVAIKDGSVDMLATASMLKERQAFAWFSIPYMKHIQVLTVRKKDAKNYVLGSLKQLFDNGFKLGMIENAYLGEELKKLQNAPTTAKNIVYFSEQPDILTAIQNGEIDGTFMAPFTLDSLKTRIDVVVKLDEYPLEILLESFHFIFSKKSVSRSKVEEFNRALAKVKLSPEYMNHPFWSTINE